MPRSGCGTSPTSATPQQQRHPVWRHISDDDGGRWDSIAEPDSLNQVASSLGLGPAQFTSYHPGPLTGVTWDWWAWVRP